ncbi:hypothetical protein J2X32_000654 [Rheinheimera pacifica]|uniref:hypothetical protein n=1 Tax=Rheinheimera pacifica TaxID=173990 RepID=UPI0028630FC2|nr:hypothetical protein [Rheinheimera pacifica]MDR6982046.1 hypothetical protein [Rheinheimera pacifica]
MPYLVLVFFMLVSLPVFCAPLLKHHAVDFIGCHWQVGESYNMQADEVGNLYFADATGYQQIEFMQLPYNPNGEEDINSEFMQVKKLKVITQGNREMRFYQLTEQILERTDSPFITYFAVAEAEAGHVLFFNLPDSEIGRVSAGCF